VRSSSLTWDASTTTSASYTQPALVGGAVIGVLSALPIVAAGNLCCCLWVVSGGVVAAFLLQQNQPAPISAGDGAVVGLLAGLAGAFIYLALSIPISILLAPMEQAMMRRLAETAGTMPPEFRNYVSGFIGRTISLALGFVAMLVAGAVFATLGGLLGAAIFATRKPPQAVVPDAPPPPA
jgi:hypothetical protein